MANSDTASNLVLPRLVLDTNVVMDLFHFNAPPLAPLMAAIESGAVICLANDRTLTELARVTGYPQFKLDDAGRHRLYEAYRSRITLTGYAVPQGAPKLPKCRDPDDQMFLELALVSNANMLISRAGELNIEYIIYAQRVWLPSSGWRAMEDRGSATANHYDHVHVTVR